ncbi:unnamed protein product [Fraxinus pennsylvanica]|uniref:Uncharacterized protein n=1 Tax=Fraxinus pennsylvanica TaxID=56036 RepID=A0AAD2AB96_9LAMI|nr:unnamed protein product [Fraxinus pennsylvanica]
MAAVIRASRSSSSSSTFTNYFIRRSLSMVASSSAAPLKSESYTPLIDTKDKNIQWVFLGCLGVGNGTFASRPSVLLGVPHIATRDFVREELSASGPLSKQVRHL